MIENIFRGRSISKFYTLLFLILSQSIVLAQDPQDARGSGRLNDSNGNNAAGEIRAVIVGVSSYSNLPKQKQLNYADDDAREFYEFLIRQPNVKKENIILLTDKQAVLPKVNGSIRQQMREANEGDTFIFFFAGHGDVQKSVDTGYLLLHEVNLGNEYSWDDAYSLKNLELNATTFAKRKKGKVILITDACHSGKLVTDNEYAKAFSTGLVQSWENTIKMVSCEPFQVSFEDAFWGGGNGVFTYYLLDALSGNADNQEADELISVRELKRYVAEKVSSDVKERKGVYQDPRFEGRQDLNLFKVDPRLTESLQAPILADNSEAINSSERGLSSFANQDLSAYTKALLNDFELAISEKRLIGIDQDKSNQKIELMDKQSITETQNPIVSLIKSEKNSSIYVIENNRVLTEWDSKSLEEKTKYRLPVLANSYVIDEKNNVLLASNNSSIKAISTKNWVDVLSTLSIEDDGRDNNKFERTRNKLIVNPRKNTIEIWATDNWRKIGDFKAGKKLISNLAVSNQANRLFVSDAKNNLHAYDLEGKALSKLGGHNSEIIKLFVSPDQKSLVSISKDGKLINWDTKSLSMKQQWIIPGIQPKISDFSPQSQWFIAATEGELVLIDLSTDSQPTFLDFDTQNLQQIIFSGNNSCYYARNKTVGKIKFKQPTRYAIDIYELLLKQSDVAPIKNDLSRELVAALQYEAQQIIKPFTMGEEVVPSVNEVTLAIKELDYALKIMDTGFGDNKTVEAKKLFLQGYEILLKHDVENYDTAIGYFEKVAELEPYAAYPNNALSLVYNKLNELKTAKRKLDQAISSTPRWYEPKSNLGITLMREGKYDSARVEFEKIISLYPNLSKGYYNMAKWYFAQGDYPNSEKNIEKALEVDADNPALIVQSALIAKERGQFEKASSLLQIALEKAKNYHKPYLELAQLMTTEYLLYAGKPNLLTQAQALLLKANELSDYLPEVNQALAAFYLDVYENYPVEPINGLPSKESCLNLADGYLEKAILLAPFDTKIYASKGRYFTLKNDLRSANNTLRNHLKKTAEFPQGYIAYGNFLLKRSDDMLNTEKQLALATNINKNYAEGYEALAAFYHQINKPNKRDSVLLKAQEVFPVSPNFYFLQGKYQVNEAENKDTGILALRKALDLDPDFRPASTALYALDANDKSEVIEVGYESVIRMENSSLLAKKNNHYFFTDITGMVISDVYYDQVELLGEGKMLLSRAGLVGYKDIKNEVSVPIEFEDIRFQKSDNSLIVKKEQKEGWLNAKGETIVPMEYEELRLMKAGTIRIKKGNFYGLLNKQDGSLLAPIKYDRITDGVWSTGQIPMMCCYFGENQSDAIDGSGKRLGSCLQR